MNPVATISPDDRKSVRPRVFFDDGADVAIFYARPDDINRVSQTFVSDANQFFTFFVNLTDEKSFVQIAVKSAMINRNVD